MSPKIRELYAFCSDTQVFNECRIRVRGKANMTLLPDYFLVEVYNPSGIDISTVKNKNSLTIKTEYGVVLCSGEVEDVYTYRSGSNDVYAISISDGQTFWEKKISKSVGPGATFSTTIRQILQGATMGSYLAKDGRFVRPQTFDGRLADFVSDIAAGVHARAFISRNVLHIVEKGKAEIVVTIEEADTITVPNTATGVCVLRTDVKGWPVGVIVEYRSKKYRLASQEINADCFEGTWETTLTLVDEDYLDEDGMDGG